MKKRFVRFYSPGTFVSEMTEKEVKSWDTQEAMRMADDIGERHGATPYGFCFFTRSRGPNDLDSKITKTSNMYYLGGTIYSLKEVKKEMPKEQILISNMECNGWKHVIVNNNSWQITRPFDKEKDTLLTYTPPSKRNGVVKV